MSQLFLHQLLSNPENRKESEKDEICSICLEEYDELNTSTGIIECQIRLPCNHGLGSSCLVTWLQKSNSCPVCRAILFDAQPQPHPERSLETGNRRPPVRLRSPARIREELAPYGRTIGASGFVPGERLDARRGIQSMSDVVMVIWDTLNMPTAILALAESMAERFASFPDSRAFSARCIAAASIYMAASATLRYRGLDSIAWTAGTRVYELVRVLRVMHPIRDDLFDLVDIERRHGGHAMTILRFVQGPHWPPLARAEGYLWGIQ